MGAGGAGGEGGVLVIFYRRIKEISYQEINQAVFRSKRGSSRRQLSVYDWF